MSKVRRELFVQSQRGSIIFLFDEEINGDASEVAISRTAKGQLLIGQSDNLPTICR